MLVIAGYQMVDIWARAGDVFADEFDGF